MYLGAKRRYINTLLFISFPFNRTKGSNTRLYIADIPETGAGAGRLSAAVDRLNVRKLSHGRHAGRVCVFVLLFFVGCLEKQAQLATSSLSERSVAVNVSVSLSVCS